MELRDERSSCSRTATTPSGVFLFRIISLALFYACSWCVINSVPLESFNDKYWGGTSGDAGFYISLAERNAQRVLTWPTKGFDIGFFYPFGQSLAFSDNYLFPALVLRVLTSVGMSPPAASNILMVVVAVLNGVFAYLLAYYIVRDFWPAVVSGFLFMHFPFLSDHVVHRQLQFAFFLPAVLLLTLRYLDDRRHVWVVSAGWIIIGAFLCSMYYALFALLIAVTTCGAYLLLRWHTLQPRQLIWAASLNVIPITILAILSAPYRSVSNELGARAQWEVHSYSSSPVAFLSAPETNLLWGSLTSQLSHSEARLFPGMTVLFLAAFCLVRILLDLRNTRAKQAVLVPRVSRVATWLGRLFLVSIYLSLFAWAFVGNDSGWVLHIRSWAIGTPLWLLLAYLATVLWTDGLISARSHSETQLNRCQMCLLLLFLTIFFAFASLGLLAAPGDGRFQPSLWGLLYTSLPGFDALRAIPRIGIVVCVCLSVLAGVGLHRVSMRIPAIAGRLALFTIVLLIAGYELRRAPLPAETIPSPPSAFDVLRQLPGDEAVMVLPIGWINGFTAQFIERQVKAMLWMRDLNRPLVNGYSGKMPAYPANMENLLQWFPDRATLSSLGQIVGLRYVLYRGRVVQRFDNSGFQGKLEQVRDQARVLAHDDQGNYLLEISPKIRFFKEPVRLLLPPRDVGRVISFELSRDRRKDDSEEVAAPLSATAIEGGEPGNSPCVLLPGVEAVTCSVALPPSRTSVHPHETVIALDSPDPHVFLHNVRVRLTSQGGPYL